MTNTPEENAKKITYLCEEAGMTVDELCDGCWIILLGRMAQLLAAYHNS
jgi:hypothetical protein